MPERIEEATRVSLDISVPKSLVEMVPAVERNLPLQITDLLKRISEIDGNTSFVNKNGAGVVARIKAVDVFTEVLGQYGKWLDDPNPVEFASSGHIADYPQLKWEQKAGTEY